MAPTEEVAGNGGEQCVDFFNQNVASGDYYFQTGFGLVDGQVTETCECGSPCVLQYLDFRPDGSFWHNWVQNTYCDFSGGPGGFCEEGTWEVPACNQLVLNHCNGGRTVGSWEVVDGDLSINADWSIDGTLVRYQESFGAGNREGGEAYGITRGTWGYSYICD